jgi:N utilization substance protein B
LGCCHGSHGDGESFQRLGITPASLRTKRVFLFLACSSGLNLFGVARPQELPNAFEAICIEAMGKRRRARELALQVLFHMEFNSGDANDAFDLICECFGSPESIRSFSRQLVLGVWEKRNELDVLIGRSSINWRLERMSRVDRNILRLAAFEVLYMKDIPPKVSIDEAVELGKRYGTEDSGAFINGVLDKIYAHVERKSREEDAK